MDLGDISAIVFDMDGTLIHSTVDFHKLKTTLARRLESVGVPPSVRDPHQTIVSILAGTDAFLSSEGRHDEAPPLRAWVDDLMNRTELEKVDETVTVEGAGEALLLLRSRGYRLGLLTRGSRAYALEALRVAGLDIGFDAMVFRDDYPEAEAKPNGLAMKRISQRLGVPAERCLLVGDHLIDLTCARSSSARFVGVLTGAFGQADWDRHEGVEVIESVRALPGLLQGEERNGA